MLAWALIYCCILCLAACICINVSVRSLLPLLLSGRGLSCCYSAVLGMPECYRDLQAVHLCEVSVARCIAEYVPIAVVTPNHAYYVCYSLL